MSDYIKDSLLPDTQIKRLKRVHNQAARLITKTKIRDHITPVLKSLHWLPIDKRINFKILCNTYKAMNGIGPSYLSEFLVPYTRGRDLRPLKNDQLTIPEVNLAVGKQAFIWCAPTLWNGIPAFIRNSTSFFSFKTSFKTFYFRQEYC